ncbi:MAG: DUF448 domain-containing protein [Micropruina sp.]|nr:DUF448 domain-containing protein [Micropruina sp.]
MSAWQTPCEPASAAGAGRPGARLSRLVWDEASSRVLSDPRQRLPGRGVYLHPGCADRVLRQRGVGRGLRRAVDADQVRALLAELTASPVWVNPPREH